MNKEQIALTELLRKSLTGENDTISVNALTNSEWDNLLGLTESQKVTGMLYDAVCDSDSVPERAVVSFQRAAVKTATQDFRLLFLARDILSRLETCSIPAVLLKGMGTASFYRNPLCRKSGDVDILIPDETRIDEAVSILEDSGFRVKEKQYALHHVVMITEDDIDIELHTMLAEPFDNERANKILKGQQDSLIITDEDGNRRLNDLYVRKIDVLGAPLTILNDSYHAYELLLHMLQHYLRKGFGIRLLCDWVVFWNRDISDAAVDKYLKLVTESGIKGFSDMVTLVCYRHLGLGKTGAKLLKAGESDYRKSEIDEFLEEFVSHGEFGKTGKGRMVALRGNGPLDYVREFHHQMRLNYPKQSENVFLWPALWVMTLVRFLINNQKIRKVSLGQVLGSAGKRGKMVRKLHLFE